MRRIGLAEQARQGGRLQHEKRRGGRGPDPAASNDPTQGPPGPFSFARDGLSANGGVRLTKHGRLAIDTIGGARWPRR